MLEYISTFRKVEQNCNTDRGGRSEAILNRYDDCKRNCIGNEQQFPNFHY